MEYLFSGARVLKEMLVPTAHAEEVSVVTAAPGISFFIRALAHKTRSAVHWNGRDYTYGDLLLDSSAMRNMLFPGIRDLNGARVAFLVPSSYLYVVTQWAIWRSGGVAVPLFPRHPPRELEYIIKDCGAATVVCDSASEYCGDLRRISEEQGAAFHEVSPESTFLNRKNPQYQHACDDVETFESPMTAKDRGALIIYTSGTTGKPKGVLSTIDNLEHQIQSLCDAWQWTKEDRILNVLPMHHIHGILNITCCALMSGACVEMESKFDPAMVWSRLTNSSDRPLTLFMAVPTIYAKLTMYYEKQSPEEKERLSKNLGHLRLMVSGSAALPVTTLQKWRQITGHTLLERFGMTEIGMALSNEIGDRRQGYVGKPLPFVEARICNEDGHEVEDGVAGELRIKGPTVFKEYWGRAEATANSFDKEGWFRTGDVAQRDADGWYRILGRESVDIIKSGGFKISALDIERELLEHDSIQTVAVVGIPDEEWGQRVGAVIVQKPGTTELDVPALKAWLKPRIAPYKIPSVVRVIDEMPLNAMGKVPKKELVPRYFPQAAAQ